MWLITIKMPNRSLTFKVDSFEIGDGRVLFKDNSGNVKNFPESCCFIEEVET